MKRPDIILACVFVFLSLVCIVLIGTAANDKPADTIYASIWHKATALPLPRDRPFCAVWIDDNQPSVYFVRKVGSWYFEYDAKNRHNASIPINDFPPIFWAEMPGGEW